MAGENSKALDILRGMSAADGRCRISYCLQGRFVENARLELATGIPRIAVHGVPRRKPAERFRRGEDEQRNEQGTAFQAVPRDMELVRTTQEPYWTSLI